MGFPSAWRLIFLTQFVLVALIAAMVMIGRGADTPPAANSSASLSPIVINSATSSEPVVVELVSEGRREVSRRDAVATEAVVETTTTTVFVIDRDQIVIRRAPSL